MRVVAGSSAPATCNRFHLVVVVVVVVRCCCCLCCHCYCHCCSSSSSTQFAAFKTYGYCMANCHIVFGLQCMQHQAFPFVLLLMQLMTMTVRAASGCCLHAVVDELCYCPCSIRLWPSCWLRWQWTLSWQDLVSTEQHGTSTVEYATLTTLPLQRLLQLTWLTSVHQTAFR